MFSFPVLQHSNSERNGEGGRAGQSIQLDVTTLSPAPGLGKPKGVGGSFVLGVGQNKGRKREQEEEGEKGRQMEEGRGRGDRIQPNTAGTGNTIKLPADLLGLTHTT